MCWCEWGSIMFILQDFLFRDKTIYHSPVQGKDSPVDKYSYLGMAVTSGNFLPASKNCGEYLSYAVGAPRYRRSSNIL